MSRFLFTGREWDPELGIYHYRARAYSPELGRFLQQDPIDFSGGDLNLSRYAGNSPLNYFDPLGLSPGKPYPTADDAGRAALKTAHDKHMNDKADLEQEYGCNIYEGKDGCFYYTPLQSGDLNAPYIKIRVDKKNMNGGKHVADYHSHLRSGESWPSPGDLDAARDFRPQYNVGHDGRMWRGNSDRTFNQIGQLK